MAELKSLKVKRGQLKAQLKRFRNFVEASDEHDEHEIKERLDKLTEVWEKFQNIQYAIREARKQGIQEQDEQIEAIETEEEAQEKEFEDSYFKLVAIAKRMLNQINSATIPVTAATTEAIPIMKQSVKLPTITLPTFTGQYSQWMHFKDSFISTIHRNPTLTEIQKLQYLRGSLKGEALEFIEELETTEENYTIAWDLLNSHYENRRLIINKNLKELFEVTPITKCNKMAIRQFVNHIRMRVKALAKLKLPVEQWDAILIYLATNKLDYHTRKDWEDHIRPRGVNELPKLDELLEFLTGQYHTLEMVEKERSVPERKSHERKHDKLALVSTAGHECEYCKGQHRIYNCENLLKLPASSRTQEIKQLKLCLNCLRKGHWSKDCKSSGCKTCKSKHNSLLHMDTKTANKEQVESASDSTNNTVSTHCIKDSHQALLSTAKVYIFDAKGQRRVCRVLLDSGSQSNLITKALSSKLHLYNKAINTPVIGIGQNKTYVNQSVVIELQSRYNETRIKIECLVVPKITEILPQTRIETSTWKIPNNLRLADEEFHNPGAIDLLLGAGMFWQILKDEHIDLLPGQPRLQNTTFGWILGGQLNMPSSNSIMCNIVTNDEMNQQLERFWKEEEIVEQKHYSTEEQACEEQFKATVQRTEEGRFIIGLPQHEEIKLADSYKRALQRFHALEHRLVRQPEIKQDYINFMEQYRMLGHMSPVKEDNLRRSPDTYYLPHHPVIRSNALTSKLRVVFDASAQSESGISLNHKLLVGPVLQDTLFELLLKFRLHQYVLTADLEMMYRQILVREADRDLQRILWRSNSNEKIQIYRLNTLTYGTSSAPFLAVRCLKELAMQERQDYPIAAEVLQHDFYMDDLLTGAHTKEEASRLQQELIDLLHKGKFHLRKWRSNDMELLKSLATQGKEDELLVLNKHENLRTLGLLWNSERDCLQYEIRLMGNQAATKRQVLSLISKIFDPLGLIGPILVMAKQLMQQLWKQQLDWDEELPAHLQASWNKYYNSINSAQVISVPRNVNSSNPSLLVDLHIFCDASEQAYGACVYTCSQREDGSSIAHLMCSKSRIAPLKSVTLPRLELNAAHLAAKLYKSIDRILSNRIKTVKFWTDSTIVLSWISTSPHRLKTYVANRVAEIQQFTSTKEWNHVSSSDNPADLLSRGATTEELSNNYKWWHGPPWLVEPSKWPSQEAINLNKVPELKNEVVLTATNSSNDILHKYSSITKLQRVLAYCIRFANNLKGNKRIEALEVEELEHATRIIVKLVQDQIFKKEIEDLKHGKELHRKSKLLPLRPFIDENGLLRVGGRVKHADINLDQRHPWVLPAKHHITTLIFKEEHKRLLHCGPEQLLSVVRLRYWPLAGRQTARKVTRQCLECFRYKPKPLDAVMADLPKDRLRSFVRPFVISGVDYAGPIQIREGKRRGRIPVTKGYIAIFVCFNTKAIHLEAVTDLTTEAFLAALRRFTSRRGLCRTIYSDNATNFVGAANELRELYQFINDKEKDIKTSLASQSIDWKFIPPRSPNFGGLWEAGVKATKRHLYIVTRNLILTYEEFSTLLAEIEAVLNSRPLTPLSSHPDDLTALTPAHFLIGDSQTEPVQKNLLSVSTSMLSRWQHQQQIRQHFWSRWQREYLHQLQMRTKWYHDSKAITPGTMVLIMDDQRPPLSWMLGRILELYPGDDNVARVAMVKTKNGIYKRAVRRLCALPMDDDNNENS